MKVTLQKPGQFGEDGPQQGDSLYAVEIRKIEGEYWVQSATLVQQDRYALYWIPLDDVLVANTDGNETVWTTLP